MDSRTLRLRQLMEKHDLQPRDVARLTDVKPPTVYGWLTDGSPYVIPPHRLELLTLRLERTRLGSAPVTLPPEARA